MQGPHFEVCAVDGHHVHGISQRGHQHQRYARTRKRRTAAKGVIEQKYTAESQADGQYRRRTYVFVEQAAHDYSHHNRIDKEYGAGNAGVHIMERLVKRQRGQAEYDAQGRNHSQLAARYTQRHMAPQQHGQKQQRRQREAPKDGGADIHAHTLERQCSKRIHAIAYCSGNAADVSFDLRRHYSKCIVRIND
ncbi:unknown [Prevotella sp. CAG:873]|nr:unknown [Prevotella sp. CAG:873]